MADQLDPVLSIEDRSADAAPGKVDSQGRETAILEPVESPCSDPDIDRACNALIVGYPQDRGSVFAVLRPVASKGSIVSVDRKFDQIMGGEEGRNLWCVEGWSLPSRPHRGD